MGATPPTAYSAPAGPAATAGPASAPYAALINSVAIQAGTTTRDDLEPCPLPPAWVLDGNPVARVLNLGKSADGLFSFGLWDCTAGKFQYVFGSDEVVHILAGEVTVEDGRSTYTLRAGDVGYFPAGLTAHWTVPRHVKKFAIHRTPRHTLLGRVRAKAGRLWRAVLTARSRTA